MKHRAIHDLGSIIERRLADALCWGATARPNNFDERHITPSVYERSSALFDIFCVMDLLLCDGSSVALHGLCQRLQEGCRAIAHPRRPRGERLGLNVPMVKSIIGAAVTGEGQSLPGGRRAQADFNWPADIFPLR